MPRLSIIVPIYNGEKYLSKCIESILAQDYTDFELILVDDGSRDGSLAICNGYAERDGRVTVLHKENGGLVAARKSGFDASHGEYVGFVDCDDYIEPYMYSDLMNAAERDGSDIVVGGIIIENEDGSEQKNAYNALSDGYYDRARIENEALPGFLAYTGFWGFGIIPGVVVKVFRRSVLNEALAHVPDNVNKGEDVAITSYAFTSAESLSVIPSFAYHYVQWNSSMVHAFSLDRFERISALYETLSRIEHIGYASALNRYMSWLIFDCVGECINKSGYDAAKVRKAVKEMLSGGMSRRVLENVDAKQLPIKDRLKIFLMRHRLVGALSLLLK
jgi:glycosyltransferase involved in cell wall biosynthesis